MQIWSNVEADSKRIAFLLFDRFSNLCLANAVEPLRAANSEAGRRIFSWRFLTLDGGPAIASSGIPVAPDAALGREGPGDLLFVIAGYDYRRHATARTSGALSAASRRYAVLAGLDTGSWLLAKAGLLDGRAATIHWEALETFAEQFPHLDVRREHFIVDGDRITCGGGMTAFDLLLALIGEGYGEALRLDVAALFMHDATQGLAGFGTGSPKGRSVKRAIALMQENIEAPLAIPEIARRVGRTQRDLAVRFRRELGASPQVVYRHLRLTVARKLVDETEFSISEIALRCGYEDPSAMTRAFKATFGVSPLGLRRTTSYFT